MTLEIMEIQHIRNATIKLKYGGATFLIDPYFAEKYTQLSFAGRSNNPISDLPVSVDSILEGVEYIMISHLHPDHFDNAAQSLVPKDMPILCQPEDCQSIESVGFQNVTPVESAIVVGKTTIYRTKGQHGSGSILKYMGPVSGYLFQSSAEKTLYWLGDTIYCHLVRESIDVHQPEIMICHAGGNKFFKQHDVFCADLQEDTEPVIMNAEQVLSLLQYWPESKVIATHLNALDHETETRESILRAAIQNNIGDGQLFIPNNGDILKF